MKNKTKSFAAALAVFLALLVFVAPVSAEGITVTTEEDLRSNLSTSGTVILGANIGVTNTLTILKETSVTLDLNGYTLSGICNAGQGHLIMVSYGAVLNVTDTSVEKDGKITYARGSSNVGWTIDLEGELNLYEGTIELTGDSWSIGYAVDVRPNAWGTEYTQPTVFHMYDGKLVSSDAAIRVASSSYASYPNVAAAFVMDDGEIDAAWDGIFIQQSDAAYDTLTVEINGGTISSALSPIRIYGPDATSVNSGAQKPMSLTITGGEFINTEFDKTKTWIIDKAILLGGGMSKENLKQYTSIEISGGTFDGDVSEYVADG